MLMRLGALAHQLSPAQGGYRRAERQVADHRHLVFGLVGLRAQQRRETQRAPGHAGKPTERFCATDRTSWSAYSPY